MQYISTRGQSPKVNFDDVLLNGLAPDGGLYVPESFPQFHPRQLKTFRSKTYAEVVYEVIRPFTTSGIPDCDLQPIVEAAYKNFSHNDIAPIRALDNGTYVCELFHGPTLAFKDFALQLLGGLFEYVLAKKQQQVTIVGATSGDTGSAAIEAFRGKENIDIFILHPKGRTSEVQRYQMTTVADDNVHNIALEGTFDDCQDMVKALFNDTVTREQLNLSAVNSINWARIMVQMAYYVYCATRPEIIGKKVSFSVPTGNFGNVLAGYYAGKMGIDIGTLCVASNENDILERFFNANDMSVQTVVETHSPSMDIQKSSNFERLLFDMLGCDGDSTRQEMENFNKTGKLTVADSVWENVIQQFKAVKKTNAETLQAIEKWHTMTQEIYDPHTVIGVEAAAEMKSDDSIMFTMATAHPAKFPDAIEKAIGKTVALPESLVDLFTRTERYDVLDNTYDGVLQYIKDRVKV